MSVVVSVLGTTLDKGGRKRWERWRPTVSLGQQEDLEVTELHLVYTRGTEALLDEVIGDFQSVSPDTVVHAYEVAWNDPWDLGEVYTKFLDLAETLPPDVLVHITTGTHIMQICWFLLVESGAIRGKLLQTRPTRTGSAWSVVDLDLRRYDMITRRFEREQEDRLSQLKQGVSTRNVRFNRMMEELETVALRSEEPVLLLGPTGAGKTALARRIHGLRQARGSVGRLVEVNCATLRGDSAMSALFGHTKGAFTGAVSARPGLLAAANGGVLFLDEIAELGLDEQAMLLRAIEDGVYLPVGADAERTSSFQLIAGTHRDLYQAVREGRFREDLLARIDLWAFRLPGLAERPEDLEPNLDFELGRLSAAWGRPLLLTADARRRFLKAGRTAPWRGNFRDLRAAVQRMATLAEGRIGLVDVDRELERLRARWQPGGDLVDRVLGERAAELDRFDRVQLREVLEVCQRSPSMAAAGRELFAVSRTRRTSSNDSDRVRKYLARFDLSWAEVRELT